MTDFKRSTADNRACREGADEGKYNSMMHHYHQKQSTSHEPEHEHADQPQHRRHAACVHKSSDENSSFWRFGNEGEVKIELTNIIGTGVEYLRYSRSGLRDNLRRKHSTHSLSTNQNMEFLPFDRTSSSARKTSRQSQLSYISILFTFLVAVLSLQSANAVSPIATDLCIPPLGHCQKHSLAPCSEILETTVLQLRAGSISSKEQRKIMSLFNKSDKKSSPKSKNDNPSLLVLFRVLFFTYYASLGSLLPYLPVYYHSLGHGGQIIGMLGAIKPFTTFLVAPLWGIISDSSGSPFTVLYFTFLVSLVAQLLVAFRHDPHWIMAMVFITAFFNAPVKSLLDAMVISHLDDRSKYGRLRLWGQLGFGVGSSGVGFLLSHSTHRPYTPPTEGTSMRDHLDEVWQSITGYKLLFFTYAILSVPTFLLIRTFDNWTRESPSADNKETSKLMSKKESTSAKKKEERPSVWQGIQLLFHNSDALLFFSLVLVVGISSGVIENFAYVRIREVGGTGKEMGLSRLVSSVAGAPMFWFSGPLTEKLGADRVLVLSLMSYVVRYFNYAFMQNPLQGLPAEALRGVTFAAFWSTCTIYASRIAPQGMQATMLMFLNAMYGGLGQSIGAIFGGKLQHKFGTVWTFIYAGMFDAFFVALIIAYLRIRTDSSFKNPQPIVPKKKETNHSHKFKKL
ncbi:major facilitator superfamily transporter [Nitzschia inconspicua]|uniref:Major facilitator superfamily transporter n=1 Tax=Nitzschia inconspicua TaxID=303405 RepID=A0A9K3M1K8_9STRA|nr:major facilitator superfamily transporter [Nitzschia inconspicua]